MQFMCLQEKPMTSLPTSQEDKVTSIDIQVDSTCYTVAVGHLLRQEILIQGPQAKGEETVGGSGSRVCKPKKLLISKSVLCNMTEVEI